MAETSPVNGHCLCGAVQMTVAQASHSVGACHCNMCLRWSGGPLLAVECGADVEFSGTEQISVFASSEWAERGFCAQCGTHLYYRLKLNGTYFVPVGLLDTDQSWVFDHQVFVDEQPAFYAFANETKNMTGAEVFAQFAPPAS